MNNAVTVRRWLAMLLLAVLFTALCAGMALANDVLKQNEAVTRDNGDIYTILNTVNLQNRSLNPIYNINVAVPLAANESTVWQDHLDEEFSPMPQKITEDEFGRRTAHYFIKRLDVGETMQLIHKTAVNNFCLTYDVSGMTEGEPTEDLAQYLQPTEDINSDMAEIVDFAAQATSSTANNYLKARLLFAAVSSYMTYDNGERASHSAATAYRTQSGNCEDYANLYAACLRSLGIPARICSGYLYGQEAQTDSTYLSPAGHINADKIRHSWVMFYIDGVGWVVADPTSGEDKNADGLADWSRFAHINEENRLIYTGDYWANNNSIKYSYQGPAPIISYSSELALYSLISPFADVVNHWAADEVIHLYYQTPRLVQGVSDKYFGVNEYLTRAEMVTLLNRVLDISQPLSDGQTNSIAYNDLSPDHWAYNEIIKGVSRGLVNGYPDGGVHPNAKISRAEAAVMLSRIIGGEDITAVSSYDDVGPEQYAWAAPAIANLRDKQIMRGVAEDTFAPSQLMTRGEGAAIIYRWLNSAAYADAYMTE